MSLSSLKLNKKMPRVSDDSDTLGFTWADWSMVLTVSGLMLVFIMWPLGELLAKSFFKEGVFSFDAYHRLFDDEISAIYATLFIASFSTFFTLLIALIIAVFLTLVRPLTRRITLFALLLTMISPPFVSSLAYITLFGRRGIITYRLLGISYNPYGYLGIIMMQVISGVSLASFLIYGALSRIDGQYMDASQDLGISQLKSLFTVVFPLIKPTLIVAALLSFVRSIADFGTPIIIGGKIRTLASLAYLAVVGRADFPKAAAMSVVILIPSIMGFYVYRRQMKASDYMRSFNIKTGTHQAFHLKLPKWLKCFLGSVTSFFLGLLTLQYITIFLSSFTHFRKGSFVFTLEYFKLMRMSILPSFFRSIIFALIAGVLTSIIGITFAYYIERKRIIGHNILDFIATLPYILPGPFFGIAYILAFNHPPLAITGTEAIIVLNCVFRQLPISTKAASATLKGVSKEIEYAAQDLGASKFAIFREIILPILKPAFLVSFINTFTATMTTVGAIIFLVTPASKVATVEMFTVLRDGEYGLAAVISTMIILTTLLINITFSRMLLNHNNTKEA